MSSIELISAEAYAALPIEAADYRIPYGEDPSQFGDLFLPDGTGPHPVVPLLHGGCWRAKYGLEPMGQFARALSTRGVAVWSLEYRRLGNGGGWPHTFLDVATGIDILPELAATYPLDPTRVVAVGHSAGGHLALWAAARPKLPADSELFSPDPLPIQRIVALAPVCDLERAVAWDICEEASDVLVGGHPREVYANYFQGSPSALLPLQVPHVTINGTHDDTVPLEYVRPFVMTAEKMGDDARLVGIPNVGHFELVVAEHPACQQVFNQILTQF